MPSSSSDSCSIQQQQQPPTTSSYPTEKEGEEDPHQKRGEFSFSLAVALSNIEKLLASNDFKSDFSAVASASTLAVGVVVAHPDRLQKVVDILRAAKIQRTSPLSKPPISIPGMNPSLRRKSSNVTNFTGVIPDEGGCWLAGGKSRYVKGMKLLAVHVVRPLDDVMLKTLSEAGALAYIRGVRVQDYECQSPALADQQTPKAQQHAEGGGTAATNKPRFTFMELFAGIGGFRVALEKIGGHCVFASELTTEARVVYSANFPNTTRLYEDVIDFRRPEAEGYTILAGDMTEIPDTQFPPHDLLTAGFPCQSFCKAGNTKGFGDNRGALFFDVIRVIKACRPRMFLLENVDNLMVLDEGYAAAVVLAELSQCGYEVDLRVVNASCLVPQSRKRVYFVGRRKNQQNSVNGDVVALDRIIIGGDVDSKQKKGASSMWNRWSSFTWPDFTKNGPVPPLRTFLDTPEIISTSTTTTGCKRIRGGEEEGNDQQQQHLEENGNNDDVGVVLRTRNLHPQQRESALRLTAVEWKTVCSRGEPRIADLDGYARTIISSYKGPTMHSEFVPFGVTSWEKNEDDFLGKTVPMASSLSKEEVGRNNIESIDAVSDNAPLPPPYRYYSLTECTRLMGFPEGFITHTNTILPGMGYKLLGNAVCPPVVGLIADAIVRQN